MEKTLLIILTVLLVMLAAVLLKLAQLEPSEGEFWDFDNPSGFHRFVPAVYAIVVMGMVLAMLWTFQAHTDALRASLPHL